MAVASSNTSPKRTQEQRFWNRVDRRSAGECWLWLGSINKARRGYGQVWFQGKQHRSHRVAFFLTYGYWPTIARHRCDNPPCCNPTHLLNGTVQDNNADMISKGRQRGPKGPLHFFHKRPDLVPRGERHGSTKYSDAFIEKIRRATGSHREIARRFGIHYGMVSDLKLYKYRRPYQGTK